MECGKLVLVHVIAYYLGMITNRRIRMVRIAVRTTCKIKVIQLVIITTHNFCEFQKFRPRLYLCRSSGIIDTLGFWFTCTVKVKCRI